MIISLYARPEKKLLIEPDPAVVHVGDRVAWELSLSSRWELKSPLLLTIYFRKEDPFRHNYGHEWSVHGEPDKPIIVEAGTAKEPGDFKYGVRIINADTGSQISDDDPRIIVVE
jgi:hypothetical protein